MARVLVIDDDEEIRTLIRAMLEGVGHEIVDALDGDQALKLFNQFKPQVVITDINMPGMDGHEVIVTFRQHVPVVAISGGAGTVEKDELLEKAAKLGAVEVIMKPFEFRQITGAVDRALGR